MDIILKARNCGGAFTSREVYKYNESNWEQN